MAVARKFVEHCCLHNSAAGELKLRYWHGGWWAWRTTHWVEIKEREVRAVLYAFTEHAIYDIGLGFLPWLPNRKKIGDLLEALTVPTLLSNNTEQPCWLDHRDIHGDPVLLRSLANLCGWEGKRQPGRCKKGPLVQCTIRIFGAHLRAFPSRKKIGLEARPPPPPLSLPGSALARFDSLDALTERGRAPSITTIPALPD